MKRIVVALLVTVVAGLISYSPNVSAQGTGGALRLGVVQCPEGYSGENYGVDCVAPATGIEFFLATPNTDNVASGVSSEFEPVTFDLGQFDLNPGGSDTVTLGERATSSGGYVVFCTANQAPLDIRYEPIDFNGGSLFGIAFEFDSGDDIVCTWYRLSDPGPDPAEPPAPVRPADSPGGVTQLPSTGSGSTAGAGWWPDMIIA